MRDGRNNTLYRMHLITRRGIMITTPLQQNNRSFLNAAHDISSVDSLYSLMAHFFSGSLERGGAKVGVEEASGCPNSCRLLLALV